MHDQHDLDLIAGYSAGDLEGAERAAAEALVDRCPDCRLLVADLRAIAAATATLPTPPRRRDFRLSTEDARRAGTRRWSPRRFFDRVGAIPSLGAGLAAIGLAGLLLASIPGSGTTSFGAATNESMPRSAAGAAAAPAAVAAPASSARATAAPAPDLAAPGGPIAAASAAPSTSSVATSTAPSAGPSSEAVRPPATPSPSTPTVVQSVPPGTVSGTPGGPSALGIASLGVLVVGVVVLVLGIVRRRRSPD
ncbi:MAG: hypothetical protein ACYDCI_14055 [Candidatus Limnocylindrales bacterium]